MLGTRLFDPGRRQHGVSGIQMLVEERADAGIHLQEALVALAERIVHQLVGPMLQRDEIVPLDTEQPRDNVDG